MDQEPREALEVLASLATAVGPALAPVDYVDQLSELAESVRLALGAQACSIALLDEHEENLVFTAASGAGADSVVGLTVPVGVGIAGWVVSSGQSLEITRGGQATRASPATWPSAPATCPAAILAAPLETENQVLGAVEVLDRDADRPGSDRDMTILDFFARHAAVAVESARLFSDMGRLLLTALASTTDDGLAADLVRPPAGAPSTPTSPTSAACSASSAGPGPPNAGWPSRLMSNVLRTPTQRAARMTVLPAWSWQFAARPPAAGGGLPLEARSPATGRGAARPARACG